MSDAFGDESAAQRDKTASSPLLQQGPAMNGETLRRTVTVTNPNGFQLMPIGEFARLAMTFQSDIGVYKGDERSNGKSPMELLSLFCEQGTELVLEATGGDADTALAALAALFDVPEPPLPKKG